MSEVVAKEERRPSLGEEIANSISHGIGLILAIAATPFLIIAALRYGNTWNMVGVSIFAASMVTLYLSSTLYHALTHDRAKRLFRMFDHSAIFLLIAGTYTPFTLGVLRGPWGWTLLGIIWALAALGLLMKIFWGPRYAWLSVILYLVMGWLVVIAAPQIIRVMPLSGLAWLAAGGVAYTSGVGFYAAHRVRYAHFAWHLFVIVGTVCHFFAVLWYSS
ncbi:MAG: hemolysin [Blastocatellia bacterium]|jgi:hemolysin III|nr:hemolysin [Blastocatellia bacterium]